jgi:DNA polymerase-3 subunit gamma/tau
MAAHDGAALFMVVDRVMEAGHEPRRFATDLLERLRDLIVLQHVPHAVEVKLIDAPEDQVAREVVQAAAFGAAELARAADVVSEALSDLRGATAPRLHLELMAARLLLPASDADERGTRARLDQLERRMSAQPTVAAAVLSAASAPVADIPQVPVAPEPVGVATDSTPATAQAPPSKPASSGRAPRKLSEVTESPAPKAQPAEVPAVVTVQPTAVTSSNSASDESGLAEMRSMWPAVLDALKTYSRVAWMAFANSAPISLSNGVLAVAIDSAGTAINIRSSGHDERLRQAILDVMRRDVKIDVVLAPNASGAAAAAAAAPTSAAAEDAPPAVVLAPIEVDAPSIDDEDAVEESGVDLVMRTLGATQIGEIQH